MILAAKLDNWADEIASTEAARSRSDEAPQGALNPMRMTSPTSPALEAALAQASDELSLQTWYRDCVRPLLRMPRSQWPRCCGAGCEPCHQTLSAVAARVQELLGIQPT
jgi:hypothetical protein